MEEGKKYLELDVSENSIVEVEEKSRTTRKKARNLQIQSLPDLQFLSDDLLKQLNNFKNPIVLQEVERIKMQQKEKIDALLASYKKPLVDNVMLEEMQRMQNKQKILFEEYKNLGLL